MRAGLGTRGSPPAGCDCKRRRDLDVEAQGSRIPTLITFPAHALLIVEERLKEQEAEGVEMPAGMDRDELALRILIAASLAGASAAAIPKRLRGGE